jgi:hypothetical protein
MAKVVRLEIDPLGEELKVSIGFAIPADTANRHRGAERQRRGRTGLDWRPDSAGDPGSRGQSRSEIRQRCSRRGDSAEFSGKRGRT